MGEVCVCGGGLLSLSAASDGVLQTAAGKASGEAGLLLCRSPVPRPAQQVAHTSSGVRGLGS